jgi:hypothetical protein
MTQKSLPLSINAEKRDYASVFHFVAEWHFTAAQKSVPKVCQKCAKSVPLVKIAATLSQQVFFLKRFI